MRLNLVSMHHEGLSVASQEVADKLGRKKISASLVTALTGDTACPARWLFESFVAPEVVEQEVDTPAVRGSIFHKVMELYFSLEPEERTRDALAQAIRDTLAIEDFKKVGSLPQVQQWLADTVRGYFQMGSRPKDVAVADLMIEGRPRKGLEVFVMGQIGGASRKALGFIDRVQTKQDGSLHILDFKTGAKAKVWKPGRKSEEGLAEQRQQVIYAMLLEQQGYKVSSANLLYPVAGQVVNVDLGDEALRERVVKDVEAADEALDCMIDSNAFEFQPSFLCAWCPLAKACPQASIKPYPKMQEAYAKQPSLDVISKGVDFES